MTPTADPTTAKEPELRTWLAELPCPVKQEGQCHPHQHRCKCQGTRRALLWASEECRRCAGTGWDGTCSTCRGSGRVKKAVGLEELVYKFPFRVIDALKAEANAMKIHSEEGYTLATLRAIVAQAQVGMR